MKNLLSKIYLILTLDCEASARLTSDSLDRKLDWSERWAARLHRLICSKSRRLNKQILAMHGALKTSTRNAETSDRLSHEAKARILKQLKNER